MFRRADSGFAATADGFCAEEIRRPHALWRSRSPDEQARPVPTTIRMRPWSTAIAEGSRERTRPSSSGWNQEESAFRLDSKRTLEIVCRSPERGRIDVESHRDGHITLFAWEHAVFTVLEHSQELFVQERPFSLEMVDGDTPRKRVELVFGDFDQRRAMQPSRWL